MVTALEGDVPAVAVSVVGVTSAAPVVVDGTSLLVVVTVVDVVVLVTVK